VNPTDHSPRPRRGRLTRSGDFDAVYQRGKSSAGRHLVVYVFARDDAPTGAPARLGMSVSKRVGGAVERNRIKRVLRERFADVAHLLPGGVDVVVIARPGAFEYIEEQGGDALGARLRELLARVTGDDRLTGVTA